MRERLLRSARNDRIRSQRTVSSLQWQNALHNANVQCTIKAHSPCHCEGLFRSNLPRFHKGELVAALLRYDILRIFTSQCLIGGLCQR